MGAQAAGGGMESEQEGGRGRAPGEEGGRDVNINSVNIFFKVLHVIPGNRSSFTAELGGKRG